MKCILCAKEIEGTPKWLSETSALCPECAEITSKYKQPDHDVVNDEIHKNKTGQIIQIVAKVIWILGAISAFIMLIIMLKIGDLTSLPSILGYLFAVFVSGLIIYGLGEIIILLGQINNKMPKKIK